MRIMTWMNMWPEWKKLSQEIYKYMETYSQELIDLNNI